MTPTATASTRERLDVVAVEASPVLQNGREIADRISQDPDLAEGLLTEERRSVVHYLDMKGWSKEAMASMLRVSRQTIWNDRKRISRRQVHLLAGMDAKTVAGDVSARAEAMRIGILRNARRFDALIEEETDRAAKGRLMEAQVRTFRAAFEIETACTKLLQDLGIVHKAPDVAELSVKWQALTVTLYRDIDRALSAAQVPPEMRERIAEHLPIPD